MVESRSTHWFEFCRWLHRRLQPIYRRRTMKTTFVKGSDAALAIQDYHDEGYARPSTMFITLRIRHALSMFDFDQAIEALKSFLAGAFPTNEIEGVPTSILLQLVRLMLDHQFGIYDGRLYRHRHGTSDRSSWMMLLVNILLADWEREWITQLHAKSEIYGRFVYIGSFLSVVDDFDRRCFDEIFITWNQSRADAEAWIERVNQKERSLQVQSFISTDVDFLDVNISWNNDNELNVHRLETSVHRQSKSEPHALPYIDDDVLPVIYRRLIRSALMRATLISMDVHQFEQERRFIECSFKLNHFSSFFISSHVVRFLREFGIDPIKFGHERQSVYGELRRRVIEHDRQQR